MADYQILPPLDADAFGALKADIAEHGVLVPVEVDETGAVIDGHHRVRAVEELRAEGVRVPDVVVGVVRALRRRRAGDLPDDGEPSPDLPDPDADRP